MQRKTYEQTDISRTILFTGRHSTVLSAVSSDKIDENGVEWGQVGKPDFAPALWFLSSREVGVSPIRILFVDDFENWRRFVVLMLQTATSLKFICEVSDGPEAVQKTQELKPDLILLDIGLPTLNGLDAARQIRGLALKPKILFLSQVSDPDVVREALTLGAGFVFKADAGRDLLAAVEAVIRGEQFLSRSLAGPQFQTAGLQL